MDPRHGRRPPLSLEKSLGGHGDDDDDEEEEEDNCGTSLAGENSQLSTRIPPPPPPRPIPRPTQQGT